MLASYSSIFITSTVIVALDPKYLSFSVMMICAVVFPAIIPLINPSSNEAILSSAIVKLTGISSLFGVISYKTVMFSLA